MRVFLASITMMFIGCAAQDTPPSAPESPIHEQYLSLISTFSGSDETFRSLAAAWEPNHAPMVLDALRFAPRGSISSGLISLLESKTGQKFGLRSNAWMQWLWQQDLKPHPEYAEFQSKLYRSIDPRFADYFDDKPKTIIRLDEVRWGGVKQDGIPPLRQPKMISRQEASYLTDSDIVFGIEINGETRAYPKRILAWHEMFVDTIQGVPLAGVY